MFQNFTTNLYLLYLRIGANECKSGIQADYLFIFHCPPKYKRTKKYYKRNLIDKKKDFIHITFEQMTRYSSSSAAQEQRLESVLILKIKIIINSV